jgi:DNA-binding response OmpR family regulator
MKILVVEDEKSIASFLKKNLQAECFSVDVANDGEKGLFLANTNHYDIIILDYVLPEMDGKEVCRKIREENDVPIIMLSVKSEPLTKSEILDLGADDYLTKPFSFIELMSRIKAVLRRPKKMQNDILQVGDLILDTKKHFLEIKSEKIHTTRKEFMLLELLMRNAGEVVSRGTIMEHVWDVNADPFSTTIETHIRGGRKKIENKLKKNMITTISGIGYKLEK